MQFSSYSGFRRHLINIHAPIDNTCVPLETPSDHESQQHDNSQCLNDETPSTSFQWQSIGAGPSVSSHSKDMCASIIAKPLGSGVPNTVVLSTIENLEEFVGDLQSNIQDQVLNLLPADNPSRSAIEELFKSMDNPFSHLNSNSKWKKYFKEKWDIVQTVELRLGVSYDSRRNSKTGNYVQVPINDKFVYTQQKYRRTNSKG